MAITGSKLTKEFLAESLDPTAVDVYWSLLPDADATPANLEVLSDRERQQAGRFTRLPLRRAYEWQRIFLRGVLAKYLGCAPKDLAFEIALGGKPGLAHPASPLQFSLSHTGSIAMLAVAAVPVGCDVERFRPCDRLGLAERYFAEDEAADVRRAEAAGDFDYFFQLWTAKEAFVKADGRGLQLPLRDFSLSSDGDRMQVRRIDEPSLTGTAWQWTMLPLTRAIGFNSKDCSPPRLFATLAVRSAAATVKVDRWFV